MGLIRYRGWVKSSRVPKGIAHLQSHLATLEDPRVQGRCDHPFLSVLMITFVGFLSGAPGWDAIEDFAQDHETWLRTFLDLPCEVPSADTYRRLMQALRPEALSACIQAWAASVSSDLAGEVVAFDGKTLRGARARAALPGALHTVHLWACKQRLLLGQTAVDGAPGEPEALLALLQLVEVKGAVVTGDANQVSKAVAEGIVQAEADYTLVVKANRQAMYTSIRDTFAARMDESPKGTVRHSRTEERGHGRTEVREGWSMRASEVPGLTDQLPGIKSVTRIERTRVLDADLRVQRDECFVVSSLLPSVGRIMEQVRTHWRVENDLHWTLDVQMGEDRCAIHDIQAAQNVALLRAFCLVLFRRDTTFKAGVARKQAKVARNTQYAEHILSLILPQDLVR